MRSAASGSESGFRGPGGPAPSAPRTDDRLLREPRLSGHRSYGPAAASWLPVTTSRRSRQGSSARAASRRQMVPRPARHGAGGRGRWRHGLCLVVMSDRRLGLPLRCCARARRAAGRRRARAPDLRAATPSVFAVIAPPPRAAAARYRSRYAPQLIPATLISAQHHPHMLASPQPGNRPPPRRQLALTQHYHPDGHRRGCPVRTSRHAGEVVAVSPSVPGADHPSRGNSRAMRATKRLSGWPHARRMSAPHGPA